MNAEEIGRRWCDIIGSENWPGEFATAIREAEAAAYERAAKVAEELRHPDYSAESEDWSAGTEAAAAAIRALATPSSPEEKKP
jgi:hypothetical protein